MRSKIALLLFPLGLSLFATGCSTPNNPPPVAAEKVVLSPVSNPVPKTPAGSYDISKVTVVPTAVFQAKPRYPVELRRARIGGEAVISFVVDTDGTVREAEIVTANDARFGDTAREAILRWRFRPAKLGGTAVPCHLMVPVVFTAGE